MSGSVSVSIRVIGDLAVLSDGPAIGTDIVTVGASMLFGAEVFGK